MSVVTFKKYSSYGDAVGDMDSAARAASEGDIDYLQKAFNSFDRDKSGFIDPQELVAALTMLGITQVDGVDDADGDHRLSLKDLDADGDQKISFEEFKVAELSPAPRTHF
jgi:Ca2+-binding EF-hand superfamily protein